MHRLIKMLMPIAVMGASIAASMQADAAVIDVGSQSNLSAAGQISTAGFGDGTLPPSIDLGGPASGRVLWFPTITGMVYWCVGGVDCYVGPEGELDTHSGTDIDAWPTGFVSGAKHNRRSFYLAGVFLDSSNLSSPPPAAVQFTSPGSGFGISDNFASLQPGLGEVFFIGDGLTGDGAGSLQTFIVPTEATHLYLGFMDADNMRGLPGTNGAYVDNKASFLIVEVQVPEPATLALLGLGLAGLGVARRSRTPAYSVKGANYA